MRFNASLGFHEVVQQENEMSPRVDTRIMSLFGAGWIAGSIKYLSESGASGITILETTGERGIIQGERSSLWPGKFRSESGMIFPVYFVLKFVSLHREMKVLKCTSSSPLSADCLALTDGRNTRFILSNFTSSIQKVSISGCKGMLKVRELCIKNYDEAVSNYLWTGDKDAIMINSKKLLEIKPFSLNFIEGWLRS
jgi:hypothetical protein